jgi:hypothetical protein
MKKALVIGVTGNGSALEVVRIDLPTALMPGRSQSAVGRCVGGSKAIELESQSASQGSRFT